MSGKVGMPFTAALHPRGFGGLFSFKPIGLKIRKKRPNKAVAHLAQPSKVMRKRGTVMVKPPQKPKSMSRRSQRAKVARGPQTA